MKIDTGNSTVTVNKSGVIKTEIIFSEGNIIEEFYPMVGDTVQTKVDNIVIQPQTFTKRVTTNGENNLKSNFGE